MGPKIYREHKCPPCKIVYLVMGDTEPQSWIEEIKIVKFDLLGGKKEFADNFGKGKWSLW